MDREAIEHPVVELAGLRDSLIRRPWQEHALEREAVAEANRLRRSAGCPTGSQLAGCGTTWVSGLRGGDAGSGVVDKPPLPASAGRHYVRSAATNWRWTSWEKALDSERGAASRTRPASLTERRQTSGPGKR
jgi:hypothetical protein